MLDDKHTCMSVTHDFPLQKVCTSVGPPIYYWDRWLVGGGLSNVPSDKEASEL